MNARVVILAALLASVASPLLLGEGAILKACRSADVLSLKAFSEPALDIPLDTVPKILEEEPGVGITLEGPVLGSMDAQQGVAIECTKTGLMLTVTISRSAEYHGALRQNVNWIPKITLKLLVHQPDLVLQSVWKMQLTNGKAISRARTPPYVEQKYPIIVHKTLQRATSQH